MKTAHLMTSFVVTVTPDATVEYAAQLMLQYRISGLPVTDSDGAVLGIVTESDLLRRAETGTDKRHARWVSLLIGSGRLAQEYVHTHGRKVGEVMTERVFTVTPETPLPDLVALMETKHVKRVPVVDQRRLVGIVTQCSSRRLRVSAGSGIEHEDALTLRADQRRHGLGVVSSGCVADNVSRVFRGSMLLARRGSTRPWLRQGARSALAATKASYV